MTTTTAPTRIDDAQRRLRIIKSPIVSTNTLRPDHLCAALIAEADHLDVELPHDLWQPAAAIAAHGGICSGCALYLPPRLAEIAPEIITEIVDHLNSECSDLGYTLGTHEGDGACLLWQPHTITGLLDRDLTDAEQAIADYCDDDPDALRNFETSDWVNNAHPYYKQLAEDWRDHEAEIKEACEEYCDSTGSSIAQLMEESGTEITEPDDVMYFMVNLGMTEIARNMLREIEQ